MIKQNFLIKFFYALLLLGVVSLGWILSFFIPELKKQMLARWLGFKQTLTELKQEQRILFFVSSAGEYEQCKPVLDRIALQRRVQAILVFNSIAGFKFAKTQGEKAPHFCAPFDFPSAWAFVFRKIDPCLCIVVRHDLLPGFAMAAGLVCPLWVINFSDRTFPSFSVRKVLARRVIRLSSKVFKVSEYGDTKYDRVLERRDRNEMKQLALKKSLLGLFGEKKIFLIGSAWAKDLELVLSSWMLLPDSLRQAWVVLFVPHNLELENIAYLVKKVQERGLKVESFNWPVLDQPPSRRTDAAFGLLKCMGFLPELYGGADLAFIGGSVDRKIHNVLEPASHAVPISCGHSFRSQAEAIDLVDSELLFSADSPEALSKWWQNGKVHEVVRRQLQEYLMKKSGAAAEVSSQIINFIERRESSSEDLQRSIKD